MFNRVIKILIVSDFFLISGLGLITPIFAVFIINNIQGGDVSVAGIAVGIYWILKSIIQIPIGRYLDKSRGRKNDYYFLIIGTLLASLIPLGFIFANLAWHLYALQIFQAIAMAIVAPSWGSIFIRHIDKGKEATTWSLGGAAAGIGAGGAGIIGGIIAKTFGFVPLFIGVSILGIFATCLFILISKNLILKTERRRLILPKTIDKL